MSVPRPQRSEALDSPSCSPASKAFPNQNEYSTINATHAAFSPVTLSGATSAAKRRSTILVHQKSPLLLATPPQITRALAYSHPFVLPLNQVAGLLSWTTGDPWQSFLLVVIYWAGVLYGDLAVRVAGPLLLVLILIAGMYGRRFSPLSSSGWAEQGAASDVKTARKTKNLSVDGPPDRPGTPGGSHQRGRSVSEMTNTRHQKTLDEMVETLKEFTGRCNILMEPLLELTDFLSTQRTPTSATTRPALTTLLVRILLCTPFWFALTVPPLRVVTTRRVVLVMGTVFLTWHARACKVARAILWRSATVRRLMALSTGLQFERPMRLAAKPPGNTNNNNNNNNKQPPRESELTKALRHARGGLGTGVRFTFILYENQRRWVGLGWTTSLFAYERAAWTDEHNNAVPPRRHFELPDVEDGSNMRWRWVDGSRWRVDGVPDEAVRPAGVQDDDGEWDFDGPGGRMGWVYYDNKWQYGRRGIDGWGRWTRRRKWYRDAELVEAGSDDEEGPDSTKRAVDKSKPNNTTTATNNNPSAGEKLASPPCSPCPPNETVPSPNPAPPTVQPSTPVLDDVANEAIDEYDSASLLSSSSRSGASRLKRIAPTRRRISGATVDSRSSRGSEDDVAGMGLARGVDLAMQDEATKRGGLGWGVGDEVRMGLE